MAYETDSRIKALEVEVVLQRHRETVQRTDRLACAGKMLVARLGRLQRPSEACLREAVYLQRQARQRAFFFNLFLGEGSGSLSY